MPHSDPAPAGPPAPVPPKTWEEQGAPGLKGVKKSPRLERPGKVRLPTQAGQAIDLGDPGIEAALDAADPGLSHERLGHGHKEAGDSTGD